jgi:hypothetical protein
VPGSARVNSIRRVSLLRDWNDASQLVEEVRQEHDSVGDGLKRFATEGRRDPVGVRVQVEDSRAWPVQEAALGPATSIADAERITFDGCSA